MNVALLVGGGVPNPTASGSALTAWSVLTHLVERGHDVTIIVIRDPVLYQPTGTAEDERTRRVRDLGAEVIPVVSRSTEHVRELSHAFHTRLRRAWRPRDHELFPHLVDQSAVRAAVAEAGSDVALAYHIEAIPASRSLERVPRFGVVGDPPHLSAWYRFRDVRPSMRALRGVVRLQAQMRHQPLVLARLLGECSEHGAFAAHHAEWLRRRGLEGCRYLRTPVPDPVGESWRDERDRNAVERPRILLVGHLKGTVTLEGLRRFAVEILPRLERALGPDGFEVRIAGGYDPPEELRGLLARPSVRFLGHVEDAGSEFLSAHVLLVPNSIPLGIRVRIITGFSYGTCIASHHSNAKGIPELTDGHNALLGRDSQGVADAVLRALGDAKLRRLLEAGARETYERFFALPLAAGAITDVLERLAPRAARRPRL